MSHQAAQKQDQVLAESYNDVPYLSFSYPMTHPDHLYTVGTLFGLSPPDFKKARVLEIGCAGGGNLLPLAVLFPEANFLGIDISRAQIDIANQQKNALEVKNIEFAEQNILDFDMAANKEKFDYIICHGIFSWVPENVRLRVLELIGECLSPRGLALVSYNTMPGWGVVRSLRDMMLFHTKNVKSPRAKVAQAQSFLDFLVESVPDSCKGYRLQLEEEKKLLSSANNSYIYHDHLEAENTQFYFYDFMKMADEEGLAYLGDASVRMMFLGNLPAKAQEKLKDIKGTVLQEQYMDFVINRRFRSTILCRKTQKINRAVDPGKIMDYYVSSEMLPLAMMPDASGEAMFETASGAKIKTYDVPTFTLFQEIAATGKYPVKAQDVMSAVQKKLGLTNPDTVKKLFVQHGMPLLLRGFMNIHSFSALCASTVGANPSAPSWARYQARQSAAPMITNILRNPLAIDSAEAIILSELDGTRSWDDLADILIVAVKAGKLDMAKEGFSDAGDAAMKVVARKRVEKILQNLSRYALLEK